MSERMNIMAKKIDKTFKEWCIENGKMYLLDEWNYERNGSLKPEMFSAGSNKKVWWKCKHGHEWKATIKHRTNGRGCRMCNSHGTSFPEQAILYYIKQYFSDTIHRYVDLGFELDVYIPSIKTAIEYDGSYYHKNGSIKEQKKNNLCKENDITLIRIRECGLCSYDDCICLHRETNKLKDLDKIIIKLLEHFNIQGCDVDTQRDYVKIMKQYKFLE